MEELKDLIRELITEVQGLRQDLSTVTNAICNTDDVREVIDDLGKQITGPLGYHLGDIHDLLHNTHLTIIENG